MLSIINFYLEKGVEGMYLTERIDKIIFIFHNLNFKLLNLHLFNICAVQSTSSKNTNSYYKKI